MSALDDELTRILNSGAARSANVPSSIRTPRVGTIDDELDSILNAGRQPSFGERAADFGRDVLHGIGYVVGAPKRAEDALVRASAKYLYGLDVPDDATTGQLTRIGAGLDPRYNPEANTYGKRALGFATEFGTDVITDPTLPFAFGSKAVQVGGIAERALARGVGEASPEVAAHLARAVEIGKRTAPAHKAAQATFGTLMGGSAIEGAADTYVKAREQGLSPEVAEAALGTLASAYFAKHAGRAAVRRTVDPFAEFNAVPARPEADRVAPERPPEPAPAPRTPLDWANDAFEAQFMRERAEPLPRQDQDFADLTDTETLTPIDAAAERAFLAPDRLAEFNAQQARERRAEAQPLSEAIRSMTDYETPAPRLGPRRHDLVGDGADMVGLSPAAAEAAGTQPTALERPAGTLLRPTAAEPAKAPEAAPVSAGAPDFAQWAEEKGFEILPENREQAARQYVEEHPDASVDQRAEAREFSGAISELALRDMTQMAALQADDGATATPAPPLPEPTMVPVPDGVRALEPTAERAPSEPIPGAQAERPPALPTALPTEPQPITPVAELGDRVADRRQAVEPVPVDRRLADRRRRVAAELALPEDSPVVQRVAQAEHEARTDSLTGLANKRGWTETQETLTADDHVVTLDGKRFKAINDTYGHEAGDIVLRTIGSRVQKHFGDESGRPGGDEFGAIVRGGTPEEALAKAEALKADLETAPVRFTKPDGTVVDLPGVEVHIGVGRNERAADLAANEGARESRIGGRGAPEPRPSDRGPEQATAGGPASGLEADAGASALKTERKTFVGGHSYARSGTGDSSAGRLGALAETPTDAPGSLEGLLKASIDLERVRKAFRGAEFKERDGAFHARIGGMEVTVEPDATIHVRDIERGAAKASAKAAGVESGRPVGATYAPLDGRMLVKIAKGADDNVIDHEALHVAMRLALSEGERKAVLKKYGWDGKGPTLEAEERAAEAYSRWTPDVPNGAFARVMSFFRRMYRSFFPDATSVFEKVRGGEAFSRESKTVDAAARQAQTPTEAQKDAGNYRKGHANIGGLDISIENEAGSQRSPHWPPLADHYGYLKGTVGKDKDHVDVFIRPGTPPDYSGPVHVVDQINKSGAFDEHKVVIGYPDAAEARAAYARNYSPGFKVGELTTFPSVDAFKAWLKDGNTTKPAAGQSVARFATRPAAGQRGLPGIAADVPDKTRAAKPEQRDLFGAADMLKPTEARATEGREGAGPLFTQDADARARSEREAQGTMFATAPLPAETRAMPGQRGIPGIGEDVPEFDIGKIGTDETVKEALGRYARRLNIAPGNELKLGAEAGLDATQVARLRVRHGDKAASYITAGKALRDQASRDILRAVELSKGAPDRLESDLEIARAITRAGAITAETTASAGAERAMHAHKFMLEAAQPTEHMFKKILRSHPALDPKRRDALLAALKSGDQRRIIAATQKAIEPRAVDKFLEAWKAGLISGPPTLVGNTVSNTVFEGQRTAERGGAGLVDAIVSKARGTEQERFASEAMASMMSLRQSVPQSLKLLWSGLLEEKIKLDSKYESQGGAIGGRTGRLVRFPFRILQAFDDAAKHIASQNELYATAWRMAMRESRKGIRHEGGASGRMAEIVNKTGKYVEARTLRDAGAELDEAAQAALSDREAGLLYANMDKAAKEATFQSEAGKFTKLAMQARTAAAPLGIPLGHLTAPFIATPSNILKEAAKRTPLGFVEAARVWKGVKEGTKTQGEFSEALARPIMGTMLGIGLYAAARNGDISGGGPNDDKKRKLLEATGWQPYSVKVGDSWYSYKRMEPIATVLGLAADMAEAKDEKTAGTVAQKLQGALIQNLTEKSWLTGITNLAQAWQDPKRYGAQWVRSLEGSLVPNVVRKAAAAIDPIVRDQRSALGPILAGIPGLSQTLPARTRGTGEEIERPSSAVERFASPFQRSAEKEGARLERELLEIDYAPSEIGQTLHIPGSKARLELSPKEVAMLREADQKTTERLRKIVESAGWRSMSGEDRKEYVEQAYAKARKDARIRLYRLPSVNRRAMEALRQSRLEATA